MSPRHPHRRRSFLKRVLVLAAPVALAAPILATPVLAADDTLPTQSRPAASQTAAVENRVLVLPFTTEGGDAAAGYGRAVQQSLATDLAAGGVLQTVTKKQPADDSDSAIAAGREAHARFVVFGQVQQVGQNVRVTGQILDVQSGKSAAVLKATGPTNAFFSMQDAVGRQALASLSGGESARDAAVPTALAPTTSTATAPAAPISSAPAMGTTASSVPGTGSYWSDYGQYEQAAPVVNNYYPPTPPIPPMYGASNYNPYAFGGGSCPSPIAVDGSNLTFVPGALGTIHTETFNSLGHSIIDPPPGLSATGSKAAASFYAAPGGPTPIPPYGAPIQAYKNPWAPFAAPVGLPQRAGPPVLRPGAPNSPGAVRGAAAAPAARGGGAASAGRSR